MHLFLSLWQQWLVWHCVSSCQLCGTGAVTCLGSSLVCRKVVVDWSLHRVDPLYPSASAAAWLCHTCQPPALLPLAAVISLASDCQGLPPGPAVGCFCPYTHHWRWHLLTLCLPLLLPQVLLQVAVAAWALIDCYACPARVSLSGDS